MPVLTEEVLQRKAGSRALSPLGNMILDEFLPAMLDHPDQKLVITMSEYASYHDGNSERSLRNGPAHREFRSPRIQADLEKAGYKISQTRVLLDGEDAFQIQLVKSR